jgi:hypothetical protein
MEVHVAVSAKVRLLLLGMILSGATASAQDWTVGATIGLVNDIEDRFRLDEFDPTDANGWVDFELEEKVLLRGTVGRMKTQGDNAGRVFPIGGSPVVLPDLDVRIDYATIGVSYQFWEGDYTSGVFGGIGGYKVNPEPASEELANFRDFHETVFGWHLGLDGDLRIFSRLSLVGRLTYHKIRSETGRSLLTANMGAAFRF